MDNWNWIVGGTFCKYIILVNVSETSEFCIVQIKGNYSTAQRHCPLTRRPEPARALIVNI